MKKVLISVKNTQPQEVTIRKQNIYKWRKKIKLYELVKLNGSLVDSLCR